jgi:hypothetical protein
MECMEQTLHSMGSLVHIPPSVAALILRSVRWKRGADVVGSIGDHRTMVPAKPADLARLCFGALSLFAELLAPRGGHTLLCQLSSPVSRCLFDRNKTPNLCRQIFSHDFSTISFETFRNLRTFRNKGRRLRGSPLPIVLRSWCKSCPGVPSSAIDRWTDPECNKRPPTLVYLVCFKTLIIMNCTLLFLCGWDVKRWACTRRARRRYRR